MSKTQFPGNQRNLSVVMLFLVLCLTPLYAHAQDKADKIENLLQSKRQFNGFNTLHMRLVENKHLIIILSNIDNGVDNSIPYEIVKILHEQPD